MNSCKNKAEYLVPWAGKQIKACDKHARQLSMLGQIIGSPIQVARVKMSDLCQQPEDPEEKQL